MTTDIYKGERTQHGCTVTVNNETLTTRHDLANKASYFDWGINSPGATQLAIAMLAYHCGSDEQRAISNYAEFEKLIIDIIPTNNWLMDREYIEINLRAIEHQNRST